MLIIDVMRTLAFSLLHPCAPPEVLKQAAATHDRLPAVAIGRLVAVQEVLALSMAESRR
jgi:hypothetical protein